MGEAKRARMLPITTENLSRMRQWGKADERFKPVMQAYLDMWARAKYRPGAPSDGFGNIMLGDDQLADPVRLEMEAWIAAREFFKADEKVVFEVMGCSHDSHARTMFLALHAAQLCCGGVPSSLIRQVLELTIEALPEDA